MNFEFKKSDFAIHFANNNNNLLISCEIDVNWPLNIIFLKGIFNCLLF